MSRITNFMNKAIVGAGLVGILALESCNEEKTLPAENIAITVAKDSNNVVQSTAVGNLWLGQEIHRDNVKLIGKDIGFVSYYLGSGDNTHGQVYLYSELLFRDPTGEELSLFGREEALYVGQNYDITFHMLQPGQKIYSISILQALEPEMLIKMSGYGGAGVEIDRYVGNDLEGVLTKYSRVKKSGGTNE